jgi:hypothetical protein
VKEKAGRQRQSEHERWRRPNAHLEASTANLLEPLELVGSDLLVLELQTLEVKRVDFLLLVGLGANGRVRLLGA